MLCRRAAAEWTIVMNSKLLWITRTGIFIALAVVLQAATAPLNNTFITGSIVNLILIVSAMTCGLSSGISVGVLSPAFAFLFGIGIKFPLIIPFVMVGNIIIVSLWFFIGNRNIKGWVIPYGLALAAGAGTKFLWLYFSVVKFAVPVLLALPENQAAAVSAAFSVPQLITASIGGALAIAILPVLKRAVPGLKEKPAT